MKEDAKREFEKVKDFAKNTSKEEFKSGGWFAKLIHFALKNYTEKATPEFFKNKYPDLNPDAIVDRRIDLAKNYAAIAGASAASAYTAAIVATIGSKGGSSPYTVPAAVTSLGAELSYISYLQLRLAYDVSVLYGRPLDYEDPEDLHDLLILAFGIKTGEVFSEALTKLAPEGIRVAIKKVITGDVLLWLKALPVVGKYLLQRNLIKTAIPVVGIGLSYGLNRYYTGKIGKRAKEVFRVKVAINNAIRDYPLKKIENLNLFLNLMWISINIDGKTSSEEIWLIREVVEKIKDIGKDDALEDFSSRINFDKEELINDLCREKDSQKDKLIDAVYFAITVNGKVKEDELSLLHEISEISSIEINEERLDKLTATFKKDL